MIKRLHDTIRSVDGYAGMAVEHDGTLVFSEGIEAAFAARLFAPVADVTKGQAHVRGQIQLM